ncbi:phage tail sheath C-terminal domain-containing protein [Sphingomonas sp. HITSZ_GF]|uniref:phage tail sheath family protein n=1 Tax=Sphingomonas sp. HITSZ_GF TaxID=3037247 RepID=UPI00240CFD93|nr:phage tail sheath C-terminal domain-containing protein [Sphingomonas sp. HITSZ_GF]MDG2533928.1 phage tail sheath C-terminal domain-containing protein [Sphingomonas sp. HITSZ_GF]
MESSYRNRSTPGVYVTEIDAFGSSIVGVETAVPVFVGYTEFAGDPVSGSTLYNSPTAISSPSEYASYFGGAAPGGSFNLAAQIALFYANGGANCYVVSVGSYWQGALPAAAAVPVPAEWTLDAIAADALVAGLGAAGYVVGATLLVIPEACLLDQQGYAQVVQAMLTQASTLQDRMAILDLPGCVAARDLDALEACQQNLSDAIAPAIASASYGAAYAPALLLPDGSVQPPSGAIAGIFTTSDARNGVWNAPANIAVEGIKGPLYNMSDAEQGGFNVPLNGQAINILRLQVNRGTVVWGARTLDGNSLDYRYVQVRRTLLYVEQSIKLALAAYVFAANDATTWQTVTASVSAFLTRLWQEGGFVGAKPSDAFTVSCGLGSTMTAQNVLDGYMVVAVTLALVHPSEFIELTFTQTMGS